jgi:hypothetical protein
MNIIGDVRRVCSVTTSSIWAAPSATRPTRSSSRAREVYAYATHGALGAVARIQGSKPSMVVTDPIARPRKCANARYRRISIAPLLGEAMRRINNGRASRACSIRTAHSGAADQRASFFRYQAQAEAMMASSQSFGVEAKHALCRSRIGDEHRRIARTSSNITAQRGLARNTCCRATTSRTE